MQKGKEREAWTKAIDLFRDLSYLWDKTHKDYFNRDMRQEAFKMLLEVFNEEVGKNTTLADFRKKFENMRTSYGRELRKVNASKQTGSGSNEIYVPQLWYYPLFKFLEGTTEPCRPGTDTLDENCWSPEMSPTTSPDRNIRAEICDKEVPEVSTKNSQSQSKKQKISMQNKQQKLLDSAQRLISREEDDWEIIGKSIGVQLKNLNSHQQIIVQKIINDALFYGKLDKLTDESMITLSPQSPSILHPSRTPHRYYHYSSPQPHQQYLIQPSSQPSPQYTFQQSPQPSPQYTSQPFPQPSPQYTSQPFPQTSPQYMTQASPQPSTQYTTQLSPQPSQVYIISQSPQASPHHTVPPSPQYIPQCTYEQPSPHQVKPASTYSSTSNDIDINLDFPNCTFSDTRIKKGTGADMKEFLIFTKKTNK